MYGHPDAVRHVRMTTHLHIFVCQILTFLNRCISVKTSLINIKLGDFENLEGAFHSTKYSGLKFWVFHATNGTVFSGALD